MRFNRPAMQLVLDRVPASAELSIAALALALLVAVPLGTLAARRRGTWIDAAASFVALAGQSVPVFWLGIMAILVFSDTLNWLPSGGVGTPAHLVLPAVTLALLPMAMVMRMLRSTLLDVQPADYVRTARAKGLGERAILMRHMYKNAAGPVVTVIGLTVGSLVGGAVIVESVFAWPGLGRLAVQAIANRDFPVVQAFVFLVALAITAVNLLVDMAYTWLDPRVRL
jgi:peptide/nickel transport system permease protein